MTAAFGFRALALAGMDGKPLFDEFLFIILIALLREIKIVFTFVV